MSSSAAVGALQKLESCQVLISTKGGKGSLLLSALRDRCILWWKGTPRCATISKERGTTLGVPTLDLLVWQEDRKESICVWEKDLGGCTICLSSGSPSSCSAPLTSGGTLSLRSASPATKDHREGCRAPPHRDSVVMGNGKCRDLGFFILCNPKNSTAWMGTKKINMKRKKTDTRFDEIMPLDTELCVRCLLNRKFLS